MKQNPSIYVAGHQGLVGAAILARLRIESHNVLLTRTHSELDLTDQTAVRRFFSEHRPDIVYLAAARVGGIYANNTYPADFIYDNLMIAANVLDSAWRSGTKRLLFLGSSCIYPRLAAQPISEDELLAGKLEPTNEAYAVAKIAGIKLCESYNRQHGTDFRAVMPTNLYGPGDNFHPSNSHVIPALIRRFHDAKEKGAPGVRVWGTGRARREFLHVDDLADACVFIMNIDKVEHNRYITPTQSHVNVGTGVDLTISDLAERIAATVGYQGEILYDETQLEGVPKKLLDTTKLTSMGWTPRVSLETGLKTTYEWFLRNRGSLRS